MPIEAGLKRQIAAAQADSEQNRGQWFPFCADDSKGSSWHTSTPLPDCGVHPELIRLTLALPTLIHPSGDSKESLFDADLHTASMPDPLALSVPTHASGLNTAGAPIARCIAEMVRCEHGQPS